MTLALYSTRWERAMGTFPDDLKGMNRSYAETIYSLLLEETSKFWEADGYNRVPVDSFTPLVEKVAQILVPYYDPFWSIPHVFHSHERLCLFVASEHYSDNTKKLDLFHSCVVIAAIAFLSEQSNMEIYMITMCGSKGHIWHVQASAGKAHHVDCSFSVNITTDTYRGEIPRLFESLADLTLTEPNRDMLKQICWMSQPNNVTA
ncbi:hypothetical protein F4803DRAFT_557376 [Xylaria telfairii]|nr:hypothetical protein F4803DRAFT_557376 [Xylaria telfairii]